MLISEIRELIAKTNPDAVLLDDPSFDNSIIGMDIEGRVVYDYLTMCNEFAQESNTSTDEAADFIDYNTIRTLPYIEGYCPVILYPLEEL